MTEWNFTSVGTLVDLQSALLSKPSSAVATWKSGKRNFRKDNHSLRSVKF